MRGWPRDNLDLPQVRELVALATIGLYEGRGEEVRRQLAARWPALEKSRMLGLEPVLATLAELRVRACVQAGAWDEARTWARPLAKIPFGRGLAALTRAALAAQRGQTEAAVAELRLAERECTGSGLDLHAAAARTRLGQLIGGDAGREALRSAAATAAICEVKRPERAFESLAPWPSDRSVR
jgi:eukaryotic-like serine/threonine-protein kinase